MAFARRTRGVGSDKGSLGGRHERVHFHKVALDTALENHHETAGIPKENLSHEQIYRAITAEANFQKRQAIIQNRLRQKTSDAGAEDGDPPKTRSP